MGEWWQTGEPWQTGECCQTIFVAPVFFQLLYSAPSTCCGLLGISGLVAAAITEAIDSSPGVLPHGRQRRWHIMLLR